MDEELYSPIIDTNNYAAPTRKYGNTSINWNLLGANGLYKYGAAQNEAKTIRPDVFKYMIQSGRRHGLNDKQIASLISASMFESDSDWKHKTGSHLGYWQLGNVSSFQNYRRAKSSNEMIDIMMRDIATKRTDHGWYNIKSRDYKTWMNPNDSVSNISDAWNRGFERYDLKDIALRRTAANRIYNIINGKHLADIDLDGVNYFESQYARYGGKLLKKNKYA